MSSDITIRHNAVHMLDIENSCVTMGVVQRVSVENNHLVGGGYTVYVDARHGEGTTADVQVINNTFGSHNYGCLAIEQCDPYIAGNVDENGNPIPGQAEGGNGGEVDPPPVVEPPPESEVAEMTGEIVVAGISYDVKLTLTSQGT